MEEMAKQAASTAASSQGSTPQALVHRSLSASPGGFGELEPAAARHGGKLVKAAAAAGDLLGAPHGMAVLHGDIHYGNILNFGARGWLAIDPKAILLGELGFAKQNGFWLKIGTPPAVVAIICERGRLVA